jgi:hypothetical protein
MLAKHFNELDARANRSTDEPRDVESFQSKSLPPEVVYQAHSRHYLRRRKSLGCIRGVINGYGQHHELVRITRKQWVPEQPYTSFRGIRAACQYTVWGEQIAWTFTFPPASQQHNSNNCGLYAAWFATTMLQSPSKSLCLNDILPFQHSRACIAMDLVARVKNLWRVKDEDPAIEEIVHYVVERQQRMKQVSNRRILPINAVHGPSPLRTVPLSANSILTPTLAPAATYAVSMTSASNPRPPPNPFSDKGSLTGPLPLPHAYTTDPSLFIRSDSIYGLHIHDGFLDLAEQQPRYTADTYMAMGTVFQTYCLTLAYLGMNPKVIE